MSVELQPEQQTKGMAARGVSIVPAEPQLSLIDLWRVCIKRRLIILLATLLCTAAAAYKAFRTPPVYESHARVEIESSDSSDMLMSNLKGLQGAGGGDDRAYWMDLNNDLQILQSDSVLFATAQNLHLRSRLEGRGRQASPAPSGPITGPERRAMINYIRGGLKVATIQDTDVVQVSYRNTDPKLAAAVVNQLLATFGDEVMQLKYDRTVQVSDWLQGQLGGLRQQTADAQRQLADFDRSHNIVGTDKDGNLNFQNLQQVSHDLEAAEADRMTKEARMRQFDSLSPELKGLLSDNQALRGLVTQLSGLETQRAELSSRFGNHYPQMQQLQVEINNVQAQMQQQEQLARLQIQAEYQGAAAVEAALRKRLGSEEQAAYKVNADAAQLAILTNQAQLSRDLYDSLETTLQEASVTAGLSAAHITVIDSAQVPFLPIAPRKRLSVELGLVGGLLCGCVLAFLIESVDDRLQTSEEVESVSKLPALAAIPHMRLEALKRKRGEGHAASQGGRAGFLLPALDEADSHGAEAYRGLRSSLLLSSIDNPPRLIAMTSAFPGEGKSTTAVNLAITLAQRGERVLLVDADLRQGGLGRVFDLPERNLGLSTILTQPESDRALSIPLPELPSLHLIATGLRPPNPAEMLASRRMEEQLRNWLDEFDRVVLDTAPLLAVSDTRALAVLADAVVLVARAGVTRKRALMKTRDLLWRINAPLTGVVVNDVNLRLENFYTYRYGMYSHGQEPDAERSQV